MTKRTYLLASTLVLAIVAAPFALAAGEGKPILGGKRSPSANATQAYTAETEIIANTSTYGTRQSNKSNNGGGAIYGCRSAAGGTPAKNEPCIRVNNLSVGLAFEFATAGVLGGTIVVSKPGDAAKPFTTNATGVATGLNADRVDSKSASDIVDDAKAAHPYAQVSSAGAAGSTRGVASGGVSRQALGDYDVVFTGDRSSCAVTATQVGTTAGQVAASPAVAGGNTTVDVRTFDAAGAPADRAVHVSLTC